ncbi:hypothetical protein ACJX0J_004143 [Zea mays]
MFSDTAIQLQPIFAQWIQNIHAGAPGVTAPGATTSTSLTWGGGELVAIGGKVALLPIPLGTADFLVHHIHAFPIHVTVLILLKGVLFARSSRLIPDKANLGFRGTCQVSAWDHVFLGLFWMYNSISVVIFHFSWKMQSDVWGGNFAQSSITINGWLRDFLWAQASQVIHLMFLFSGRGYWQELIESIVWAHNKLKVAPATQPRALSIIQGRAVGVTHYLLGELPQHGLAQDPTTRRIWFGIATAHDFESHDDITEERLYQNIFASHFGQLAIIFLWTSGNLFHVAWQGNFESWIQDPLHVRPIAHAIWDPHFGQPAVNEYRLFWVYQWWYTIGLRTNEDLYTGALFLLFLSTLSLIGGWLHLQPKWKPSLSWFKNAESRLNHHLHLVHVAIPGSRGEYVRWNNFLDVLPYPQGLGPLLTGHLWLTDIAHHHLAIAFIFLIAGHMYRTNFGIGHSIKDLLEAHTPPGGRLGRGHKGLYDTINNSIHFQLGLALASLGVITSFSSSTYVLLPAYAFIAQDFTTQAALYTHHQYIAGDYNPEQNEDNVLARMLDHKEAIISHLSWASLFLGFHTLGLYVHNDVMLAFGTPEKQS